MKIVGLSLAGNLAWIGPVLDSTKGKFELFDAHYYPNFAWDSIIGDTVRYQEWLAAVDTGGIGKGPLESTIDEIRDSIFVHSGGNPIELTVLEYNCGIVIVPDPLWWNYLDGLFVADAIGHLMKKNIPIGAVYSIYEKPGSAGEFPIFGMIRGDTVSRRMASYVLEFYRTHFGNELINAFSSAVNNGQGLEVYASKREDGGIVLFGINKNPDTTFNTTINLHGFESTGEARCFSINNDAPISAPANGTTGIKDEGIIIGDSTRFNYDFPPYSITALVIANKIGLMENALVNKSVLSVYPNPFTRSTTITFSLPIKERVSIAVYDVTGRRLEQLLLGQQGAGIHKVYLKTNFSSGVYFIALQTDKKCVLDKIVKCR